ncbi:MAG TPA: glycosyltransferase family 4 protein [Acidimicrobiia bacterium]|nr:glycosyltransferase family 4 protein [Acidimicrobiia bacterium]
MKLAVVTPRYGREVPGGAETAARLLATHLATRPGFTVEALTTCALDATTWTDHYEPGETEIDGVHVRRFPVKGRRSADFDARTERVIGLGRRVTDAEQQEWLDKQGPVAPGLIDAIARSDADAFAFHPYMYHPTVAGLPAVADRAILHPAAHDEPVFRLPFYGPLFERAAALAYWSEPERRLVEQRFPVAAKPALVVGLGVDAGEGTPQSAQKALGLDDRPYVLCLGRVDDGKGARLLADCFAQYKSRRGGDLRLVFAGPVVNALPDHPDIVVAGAVDEPVKWGLLRGARALVSPSAFESFSIVLMEAWSVGTPALVNRRCAVTLDHVRRSGGGLAFGSYAELEVELERIAGSASLRAALGHAGRSFVDGHYRWSDVIDRYASFVQAVGTRGARRSA